MLVTLVEEKHQPPPNTVTFLRVYVGNISGDEMPLAYGAVAVDPWALFNNEQRHAVPPKRRPHCRFDATPAAYDHHRIRGTSVLSYGLGSSPPTCTDHKFFLPECD